MKIMKFGGTSVGKPERMHQVAELIQRDKEPKIVVLSALSGTTNALVDISNNLAVFDKQSAKHNIDKLEAHYRDFVPGLVQTAEARKAAYKIIDEHLNF